MAARQVLQINHAILLAGVTKRIHGKFRVVRETCHADRKLGGHRRGECDAKNRSDEEIVGLHKEARASRFQEQAHDQRGPETSEGFCGEGSGLDV